MCVLGYFRNYQIKREMKTSSKIRKSIALLLSLIILSSCTIYKKSTLEEVSQIDNKVLIMSKEGKRLKYYKVVKKDGEYWGQTKPKNDYVLETKIDANKVSIVKKQNPELSTLSTVTISILSAVGLFAIAFAIGGGIGF